MTALFSLTIDDGTVHRAAPSSIRPLGTLYEGTVDEVVNSDINNDFETNTYWIKIF